ncbi:MAG TPA: carboxypeptidase regulatory-like domain-containing protein, partial [Micropepsaceae bacterium]|nr:carboxypeptidase regulatory-like domain-containing protein [Micropepsaceae bacterium]
MSGRMISALLSAVATAALLNIPGAQAQSGMALAGTVTSAQEGAMEGVIVSAKKEGGHITISVVSDEKGHYAFPADRLEPGHYDIKIRAIGYIADNRPEADVASGKTTNLDLKLDKTNNIAPQLTSAEWLASMPGTDEQKAFLQDCTTCHTLIRPLSSGFTAEDFEKIIPRMGTYAPGSQPQRPQKLLPGPRGNRGIVDAAKVKAAAEYLASVNLSKDETWKYPFVTFPRPKGRATHVIYTSYDLPRVEAMPHDVILVNGKVYFSDFGSQFIGEMDPATGKVIDHPVQVLKPDEPKG